MPRLTMLASLLIAVIPCGSHQADGNSQLTTQPLIKTPLAFTKNMGQWDSAVLRHSCFR